MTRTRDLDDLAARLAADEPMTADGFRAFIATLPDDWQPTPWQVDLLATIADDDRRSRARVIVTADRGRREIQDGKAVLLAYAIACGATPHVVCRDRAEADRVYARAQAIVAQMGRRTVAGGEVAP